MTRLKLRIVFINSSKHSEYEHLKEFENKVYNTRTPTGEVKVRARNFLNNPAKKGLGRTTTGHLFGQTEYVADPYDRKDELERVLNHSMSQLERIVQRSKFLPNTRGFISTSTGNRPFTADDQVFDGAGYVYH